MVPKLLRLYPNLHLALSDGTAFNAIAQNPAYDPAYLEELKDKTYFRTDFCYQGVQSSCRSCCCGGGLRNRSPYSLK